MATDNFQAHDYFLMDELLTDEHKLIRDTARAWVKKEVTPTVEEFAQKAEFPKHWINRCFWTIYPYRIWWPWIRPNFIRYLNARN